MKSLALKRSRNAASVLVGGAPHCGIDAHGGGFKDGVVLIDGWY